MRILLKSCPSSRKVSGVICSWIRPHFASHSKDVNSPTHTIIRIKSSTTQGEYIIKSKSSAVFSSLTKTIFPFHSKFIWVIAPSIPSECNYWNLFLQFIKCSTLGHFKIAQQTILVKSQISTILIVIAIQHQTIMG